MSTPNFYANNVTANGLVVAPQLQTSSVLYPGAGYAVASGVNMQFFSPGSGGWYWQNFNQSQNVVIFTSAGDVQATSFTTTGGDIRAARSTTTGVVFVGGSASWGSMDWALAGNGFNFSFKNNAGSYAGMFGGAYTNASDARYKANVVDTSRGLAEVLALRPRDFNLLSDGTRNVGFIAQEVQPVVPELVSTDEEGFMGVCYDGVIPILVKAIQELTARIKTLEARPLLVGPA